jgi:hypothetical protein
MPSSEEASEHIRIALHSAYLCLIVPYTFGVITIFGSQQETRNIEKGFTPGHKNVHFFQEQPEQHEAQPPTECRKLIEAEGEFKKYHWIQESRTRLYTLAPKLIGNTKRSF